MLNEILTHYSNGKFGIPTALPNHTFSPKGLRLWLRFEDMPNGSRRANLRDNQLEGMAQLTLFSALGEPLTELEAKKQQILEHFKTETAVEIGDKTLYIDSSYPTQGVPVNGWFMVPITVNYHII